MYQNIGSIQKHLWSLQCWSTVNWKKEAWSTGQLVEGARNKEKGATYTSTESSIKRGAEPDFVLRLVSSHRTARASSIDAIYPGSNRWRRTLLERCSRQRKRR